MFFWESDSVVSAALRVILPSVFSGREAGRLQESQVGTFLRAWGKLLAAELCCKEEKNEGTLYDVWLSASQE